MTREERNAAALRVAYGMDPEAGEIISGHSVTPYGMLPVRNMKVRLNDAGNPVVNIGDHADGFKKGREARGSVNVSGAEGAVLRAQGFTLAEDGKKIASGPYDHSTGPAGPMAQMGGRVPNKAREVRNAAALRVAYGMDPAAGEIISGHSVTPYGMLPVWGMKVRLNGVDDPVNIGEHVRALKKQRGVPNSADVSPLAAVVLRAQGFTLTEDGKKIASGPYGHSTGPAGPVAGQGQVMTPAPQPALRPVAGPAPATVPAAPVFAATAAAARTHPVAGSNDEALRQWAAASEKLPAFATRLANHRSHLQLAALGSGNAVHPGSFEAFKEMCVVNPHTWKDPISLRWLQQWKNEDTRGLGGPAAALHHQQSQPSSYGQGGQPSSLGR